MFRIAVNLNVHYLLNAMYKNLISYLTLPLRDCYTDNNGKNYKSKDFILLAEGNERLAELIFNACNGETPEEAVQVLIDAGRVERCPFCHRIYMSKKRDCPFCQRAVFIQERNEGRLDIDDPNFL